MAESEGADCSRSRETTPVSAEACPICLTDVTSASERAHVMPCLHAFCFSCIRRWAQLRRECPLCKGIFTSILYNVHSDGRHEELVLNSLHSLKLRCTGSSDAVTERPTAVTSLLRDARLEYETLRSGMAASDLHYPPQSQSFYRYSRTNTRSNPDRHPHNEPQRSADGTLAEPRPYFHRVQRQMSSRAPEVVQQPAQRDADDSELWRRSLYSTGCWALTMPAASPSDRPPQEASRGSAAIAQHGRRSSATATVAAREQRLDEWVTRELRALLRQQDVLVVKGLALSLLKSKSPRHAEMQQRPQHELSPQDALQPFLRHHAHHFWHELCAFAATRYSLQTYDRLVRYGTEAQATDVSGTVTFPQSSSGAPLLPEAAQRVLPSSAVAGGIDGNVPSASNSQPSLSVLASVQYDANTSQVNMQPHTSACSSVPTGSQNTSREFHLHPTISPSSVNPDQHDTAMHSTTRQAARSRADHHDLGTADQRHCSRERRSTDFQHQHYRHHRHHQHHQLHQHQHHQHQHQLHQQQNQQQPPEKSSGLEAGSEPEAQTTGNNLRGQLELCGNPHTTGTPSPQRQHPLLGEQHRSTSGTVDDPIVLSDEETLSPALPSDAGARQLPDARVHSARAPDVPTSSAAAKQPAAAVPPLQLSTTRCTADALLPAGSTLDALRQQALHARIRPSDKSVRKRRFGVESNSGIQRAQDGKGHCGARGPRLQGQQSSKETSARSCSSRMRLSVKSDRMKSDRTPCSDGKSDQGVWSIRSSVPSTLRRSDCCGTEQARTHQASSSTDTLDTLHLAELLPNSQEDDRWQMDC